MIFNNKDLAVIKGMGVPKRCGGQGDIISGLTMLYTKMFQGKTGSNIAGACAASYLVRKTGMLLSTGHIGEGGMAKTLLSLTASDILKLLPVAIHQLIGF